MIHDSLVIILENTMGLWDYLLPTIHFFPPLVYLYLDAQSIVLGQMWSLFVCSHPKQAKLKTSDLWQNLLSEWFWIDRKQPAVAQAEKLLLHLLPQIPHQTHTLDKITSAPLNNHGQDIKYLQCLIFVFGCACVQSPAWIFVTWHKYKYRKSPNLRNCSPFHLGNRKSVWIWMLITEQRLQHKHDCSSTEGKVA